MFDGYYSKTRFAYVHREWEKRRMVDRRGDCAIRKTACLYSPRFNVYIDTSDGVNEDLPIPEYCGRMKRVITDAQGKPFLYFKCSASPVKSKPIANLAAKHGGVVVPFMQLPYNKAWFKHRQFRSRLTTQRKLVQPTHDIGMAANLTAYEYPRPDKADTEVSWQDAQRFGFGRGEDMGFFAINTRRVLHEQLGSSPFTYVHLEKIPYRRYIRASQSWRVTLCPPGMGEYTQRIFDHGFMGQTMLIRATTYDFGYSWKEWIPELDFSSATWVDTLSNITREYRSWDAKAHHYFNTFLSPEAIVSYLSAKIDEFQSGASTVRGAIERAQKVEEAA